MTIQVATDCVEKTHKYATEETDIDNKIAGSSLRGEGSKVKPGKPGCDHIITKTS